MILQGLRIAIRWFPTFLLFALAITAVGAVIGLVAYSLAGPALDGGRSLGQLAIKGLQDGAFLAGIWAPGTAFVLCFVRAHSVRVKRERGQS